MRGAKRQSLSAPRCRRVSLGPKQRQPALHGQVARLLPELHSGLGWLFVSRRAEPTRLERAHGEGPVRETAKVWI
jgi:hypothetical protein